MNLTFTNGNAEQQGWVTQTIELCLYDFDRVDSDVAILFAEPDPNTGDDFHVFARTTWTAAPTDPCGRPSKAQIIIRPDLPTYLATFDGVPSTRKHDDPIYGAYDVIAHELGHVVQTKFADGDRSGVCGLYGAPEADWDGPSDWTLMVKEAHAETFKDVFLQGNRQWDNRTQRQLSQTKYANWLAILDLICPCEGGGVVS